MTKNLSKLFVSVAMPALMITGCATVQHVDMDACKTWSQTSTPLIPVVSVSSTSGQKFSSSCDEGRTAAYATLASHQGKNLHFASAFVGKEFLKAKETEIQTGKNVAYNTDVLKAFNYFLGQNGVSKSDIDTALIPPSEKTKPASICTGTGIAKHCDKSPH
jgi:hypothetical protein